MITTPSSLGQHSGEKQRDETFLSIALGILGLPLLRAATGTGESSSMIDMSTGITLDLLME